MAAYAAADQKIKDQTIRSRVHVALLRWSVSQLQGSPFDAGSANRDSLAQQILRTRGNTNFIVNTLIQTMIVLPSFDTTALDDTGAGDTALQAEVDTLVPALLIKNVIVVGPPDINP
jgi:hypothetical protein